MHVKIRNTEIEKFHASFFVFVLILGLTDNLSSIYPTVEAA